MHLSKRATIGASIIFLFVVGAYASDYVLSHKDDADGLKMGNATVCAVEKMTKVEKQKIAIAMSKEPNEGWKLYHETLGYLLRACGDVDGRYAKKWKNTAGFLLATDPEYLKFSAGLSPGKE